jgi:methyl-accepting chemotaxis protein
VPNIRKTSELISEISAACREQDIGASQINEAIQQLDKVIQTNASTSEEMTATADELSTQADELQAALAYFRTDATGAAHGAGHHASRTREAAKTRPTQARAAPKFSPPAKAHLAHKPARKPAEPKGRFLPMRPSGGPTGAAPSHGFALDLAVGGPDEADADFKPYN